MTSVRWERERGFFRRQRLLQPQGIFFLGARSKSQSSNQTTSSRSASHSAEINSIVRDLFLGSEAFFFSF